MATKTFEELKQLAIQIRDEKTNKQNTATRIGTQMLEHLDKLEQDYYDKTATDEELKERDEKLIELGNKAAGINYVTCDTAAGTAAKTITETGLTALTTGIRLLVKMTNNNTASNVTLNINSLGAKPLYYNNERVSGDNAWEAGEVIDVYYDGTNFYSGKFEGGSGEGGNLILEWNTDAATTRKQVKQSKRKSLLQISYKDVDGNLINEQYVGTTFTDTEWTKDSNWDKIPNQKQISEIGKTVGALGNNILPLLNTDTCDVSQYKSIGIGLANYKMTYSDADFGNLGTPMTILIKFVSNMAYQSGMPNIIIQKGDYNTNGWALMYKNESGDNSIYFCIEGTYYPILSGLPRLFSQYTEIAISSGKNTKVYLFNKEMLSLDNVTTDSKSAITVGGESDRYTFEILHYLSFTYYERTLDSMSDEFEKICHNFSRKEIEAQFVASPISLNNYGYSTNEQFSLTSSRAIPDSLITTSDLSIPDGYINGISIFDSFNIYTLSSVRISYIINVQSNYTFTTKKINVEGYKSIEIHNVHTDGNSPILIFFGDSDYVLGYIISNSIKPTESGTYTGYRDTYTFEFPTGTKKIAMLLKYNSYFKLIEKDEELIQAEELTSKPSRIYERTPIILFDSASLINGSPISYYNAQNKWMSVNQNSNTLKVATELLTGFSDTYKVYNAVYKDSNNNIGIIHVYRIDVSGTLYILDSSYPDNITGITTHAYNGSGEMHLSSNASKAVGYALADATKDTLNYLVNGISGYSQMKQLKPRMYSFSETSYLNSHTLLDPLGRAVFNVSGIYQSAGANELSSEWGIQQNTYNNVYLSTASGKIISLKQIAKYKRGYYEISAVTPRYNFSNKENVSSSKVTCTVKNNGKIVDKFIVNDWMAERKCVFLDERNTSGYLLNVNTEAGDNSYSLQSAINAVSGRLDINTILMFRQSNYYYCYIYKGDNEGGLKNEINWAPFEWDNVEILFEQESDGKATLFLNRVLQVQENTRLTAYPITSDSYLAWLGDSWTYAADDDENNTRDYPPLLQYDFDNFENSEASQPTENKNQCPLPRALSDKTGCKIDLWGRGTKTASWAWQYQVWRIINTKKYTHIVIEYFSNDQSSDNDNVAEVTAIARVCQNNGIIPIILGPTTSAKSYWYNQYRIGF